MKRLNLGCGSDIKVDCINLDRNEGKGIDVVWDLDKFPYPFSNESIDRIFAFHILEHVENYEMTLKEINRIMKPGGALYIRVPHFSAPIANSEFHKRFFCFTNAFTHKRLKKDATDKDLQNYFGFELIHKELRFDKRFMPWNWLVEPIVKAITPQVYEATFLKSLFPALELYVVMIKRKGGD